MTKWRVAGMYATEAQRILERELGAVAQVQVRSDVEGAQDLAAGEADFYVGVCATGGGGALAMAQVFVGPTRCQTLARGDTVAGIRQSLADGVVCFGVPADALESLLPILVQAIRHDPPA